MLGIYASQPTPSVRVAGSIPAEMGHLLEPTGEDHVLTLEENAASLERRLAEEKTSHARLAVIVEAGEKQADRWLNWSGLGSLTAAPSLFANMAGHGSFALTIALTVVAAGCIVKSARLRSRNFDKRQMVERSPGELARLQEEVEQAREKAQRARQDWNFFRKEAPVGGVVSIHEQEVHVGSLRLPRNV